MAKAKLIDPVQQGAGAENEAGEFDSLNIAKAPTSEEANTSEDTASGLSFQTIPPERARITRPFDGYPLKKFKFNDIETYSTFIVALNPTVPVPQDPANRKVRTKKGMVQVQTHHSRVIRDRETKENTHVPFDRIIKIQGRDYQCAIVQSHNVRAQLAFKWDNQKNRIEVDHRYMLLDMDQVSRLKRTFEQVINPRVKMEREADFIAGRTSDDSGGVEPLTE